MKTVLFLNEFPDFTIPKSPSEIKMYHTINVETFNFLGGEVHVKLNDSGNIKYPSNEVTIFARANSSDDVMRILLTNDALVRMGYKNNNLFIPYLPYARQDRVMVEGEPFSLKVFTDMLKSCDFNRIFVFDPHSDISTTLLEKNIHVISNVDFVKTCLEDIGGNPLLVSPDSGSYKKIFKLASELEYKDEIVLCNKARNLNDGKILAYSVDKADLGGRDVVICDDICSRGGTFMGLASSLKNRNAGKIYLIVSHYEGSADISKLKESGIERVYTTDSIGKVDDEFVKVIPMVELIDVY